jgi:hypothetical protein
MSLPDTDPPFYFRRVYQGATDLDEVMVMRSTPDGRLEVIMGVPGPDAPELKMQPDDLDLFETPDGLVIYGREVAPDNPWDSVIIEKERKRGLIFSQCFSVLAPDGELGFQPIATLTQISKEEWMEAADRGWEP